LKILFEKNDPQLLKKLLQDDDNVDRLYEQIKLYLAKLSRESMVPMQAKRHVDILMFIINLEHMGDIIVKNLCELVQKKWRNDITFSKQGWDEISAYHEHVAQNFRLALTVFHSSDVQLARELVKQKEELQRETQSTAGSHFERLRQGLLESLGSSSVHLDVIRDLRRINDHLTSVAYGILEAEGALQSRLK
jgi:phosphate:Na+ symporter